jgi:hypothetical protein
LRDASTVGRHILPPFFMETLINSVLRANRGSSPPLEGWRERSERRGGALHSAKRIFPRFQKDSQADAKALDATQTEQL